MVCPHVSLWTVDPAVGPLLFLLALALVGRMGLGLCWVEGLEIGLSQVQLLLFIGWGPSLSLSGLGSGWWGV